MKRLLISVYTCDPGKNDRAPLEDVQGSKGNQNPRAEGGDVY